MSRARIDAKRVADAASRALQVLEKDESTSEQVRVKKEVMIRRMQNLATAADQSGEKITLTAEEFGLIAHNWQ